jgi:predicted anti-sigma-YlaC factor YlaD
MYGIQTMNKEHRENALEKIKAQLGEDFDSAVLEDVAKHLEDCPDCRIYYDSVKQTVKIYRVNETETDIPSEVSDRLYKVLKL